MRRLAPDEADARFTRRVFILAAIVGLFVVLYKATDLLILAFGSVLGAVVIRTIDDLLIRRARVPPRAALGLAIAIVLTIVGVLVWLFTVQFSSQISALIRALPQLVADGEARLRVSPVGDTIANALRAAYQGSRVAQDLGSLAEGAVTLTLNALLLLVGSIFFALDPAGYRRGILLLVPKGKRGAIGDAFDDLAVTLRLWLKTQLINMTAIGLLTGLGLWAVGVPSPGALGLLAGIAEFIPYVGPVAAMLPALGLAATESNEAFIGALAIYALVRLIQTPFITPLVQQRVIAIPPAVTLFAIIAIGVVFGVFGLFFSAAILVAVFSLINSLYLREVIGEDVMPGRHHDPDHSPEHRDVGTPPRTDAEAAAARRVS